MENRQSTLKAGDSASSLNDIFDALKIGEDHEMVK